VLLLGVLIAVGARAQAEELVVREFRQHVEADYALQARLRVSTPAHAGAVTPKEDAAGGCDGFLSGSYGFHTSLMDNPWWQVDLGHRQPLTRVIVWNRCGNDMASRAAHMMLRLSDDGQTWRTVYQHDGTAFQGVSDNAPLVISTPDEQARFVRIELPGTAYLHLDEVEVFGPNGLYGETVSIAKGRPATQSGVSEWSTAQVAPAEAAALDEAKLRDRRAKREALFNDPLLNFDAILFTKRVPSMFTHMSDQYLGWWSRPGGGIYILRNYTSDNPTEECLTESFTEPGSFLRPMLSYDGTKVLFAWCRYYPEVSHTANKLDKAALPEDSFFHIYEMNNDGSNVRKLTHGRYNDFDAQYLPDGRIVFLSTRRGHAIQAGRESAAMTVADDDLPEAYVRCGGDQYRPCAVYTLHTMDANGSNLCAISPFEMFEWTPTIAHDGTILYSRWDYIDRDNMPFMSLWSINPDGTNARLVYGNFTRTPHCTFEPRSIPDSNAIVFTGSAHHSHTVGSLVRLNPAAGTEGNDPITRLTPDVVFPEAEGWPRAAYANPWPLSDRLHLVVWGEETTVALDGLTSRSTNSMGLYLLDAATGQLELLYRDPEISIASPMPLRARKRPPIVASDVDWTGPQEGTFLLADVYQGMSTVQRGDIKALRIVAVPPKTQPDMDSPLMGLTHDDPGKCVLGTVPVEEDGSAYFRVPSGITLFFQALDAEGMAVQTMRSATHVQPGQKLSCVGCHESRTQAPISHPLLAAERAPSRITPGPEGSWPFRFDTLVQPVLDRQCVACHQPGAAAPTFDLRPEKAYDTLVRYGSPSLYDHVLARYKQGRSFEGQCAARTSALLKKLDEPDGHHDVGLSDDDRERLITWMDTYAQRLGSFGPEQEERLRELREKYAYLLAAAE
jgi:hypothetical protein